MAGDNAFQAGHSDDPEDPDWDNDSTMGESIASSTCSLTPSVAQYEHQHGRRYHAFRAGKYYMPNDEKEQDLMDLVHYIGLVVELSLSLYMMGEILSKIHYKAGFIYHRANIIEQVHDNRLYLAPLKAPTSILDVGTGTGTWAFEVADLFPGAYVVGTDLSPIQPSWVPPNLQFEVSDCEDDWSFSSQFDLIHMRNLSGSITDWPRLLVQAHQFLKREGWLDIVNLDIWFESNNNSLPENSALAQWRGLVSEAVERTGRIPRSARLIRQYVMDAGFVSVTEEVFKLPLSPWIQDAKWKKTAQLMQYLMERELEGISLALFTRVLDWSVEDLRDLLTRARADMANLEYEMYCNVHYVYGQKSRGCNEDMLYDMG